MSYSKFAEWQYLPLTLLMAFTVLTGWGWGGEVEGFGVERAVLKLMS